MSTRIRVLQVFLIICSVDCTLLMIDFRESRRTNDGKERSGAYEALDFWTRARAYPHPDISPDKHFKAYQVARARFKDEAYLPQHYSGWEFIGPNNLSGRMISAALNPLNPSTIYAGSASGGVWRSYTGGVAGDWQRIVTGYPVLGVGAIAIAPNDSNVIYIGTGEVYRYEGAAGGLVVRTTRGSYGIGILKSTDGGTSWAKSIDWTENQQRGVQVIKINPLNPNTVWAGTTEGIYKSTNAGASWDFIVPANMCMDLIIHRIDTNRVIASFGNFGSGIGIYRTDDGGQNWSSVVGLPSYSGKTMLEQYYSNPDKIYASVADSTTGVGSLWMSTDFGTSWSSLTSSPSHLGVQGWYSHYVAVHPFDSSQIAYNAVGRLKSTNAGGSFSSPVGGYSDNHAFAYSPSDPSVFYTACDDGIYRSTDFGTTFTPVNNNLATGQFYNGFSNSQQDSSLAIVQSQDHIPGYIYSGSTAWGRSARDEAGWTAIDPNNDMLMYAINRNGGSVGKSTNRGVSFSAAVGLSSFGAWNSPLIIAPSNPAVLYAGKTLVHKSTNSSANWAATNGGISLDGNPALAIAISYTSTDTVYVGTAPYVSSGHIFRTTNAGTSWTNITGPLPDRYPLDLATDPTNSRIVYAAFGGFGSGHIFKSTDAGGSWNDITNTLPDIPATALLVDPQNSSVVYVGTDVGVFVSTNGGASWNSFNDGLPDAVLVSDLSMTASNRTIRVSTHGNGAFQRRMPTSFPALSVQSPNGGETLLSNSIHLITWSQALVPTVTIDYSTDNGGTWMQIATNVSSSLPGFEWTVPFTPSTQALVRVRSTTDTNLTSQSSAPFTIHFEGTFVNVHERWNMISLPVVVSDSAVTTVFPGATSSAYAYSGGYVTSSTLERGRGYWLKFGSTELVPLYGDTVSSDSIPVSMDWTLIGSITYPVPVSSIGSDPPGIIVSNFYGYDGAGYTIEDTLLPGRGYWVKANQAGVLTISSGANPMTESRIIVRPGTDLPPPPPGTGISVLSGIPGAILLAQNFPNPFNPTTQIRFSIDGPMLVSIEVFDVLGKFVTTIVQERLEAGVYERTFTGTGLPSGSYFVRLTAGEFTQTRKIVLLR